MKRLNENDEGNWGNLPFLYAVGRIHNRVRSPIDYAGYSTQWHRLVPDGVHNA